MKEINAEQAYELMFELFKIHPWLLEPGMIRPNDLHAEKEACDFILRGDFSDEWQDCSMPAQRVVAAVLADFLTSLRTKGHSINASSWQVPEGVAPWEQALAVVQQEIVRTHPHSLLSE